MRFDFFIKILIYLAVLIVLLSAAWGAKSAAPWIPTRRKDKSRMAVLGDVKEGDVVYDLGSGDGRLVFEASNKGAKAYGVEIFILPFLYSWIKSFWHKKSKIIFGDLFKRNISDANVVFVFLLNKCYGRLVEKFEKELKPGTKIVVGCWPIKELENKLVKRDKPTEIDLPIYVYEL